MLQVAKSPSLLMRGLLVNFVVIPVLFYLSLWWLPVSPFVKMGIMLMAAAPIAPMAPLPFVGVAKGDLAYSAGLMVIAAVLSVALTPLIIALAFPSGEGSVSVDPMQIVETLLTVQLIPMGVVIRARVTSLGSQVVIARARAYVFAHELGHPLRAVVATFTPPVPPWRGADGAFLCRAAAVAQLHDLGRLGVAGRGDDRADALGGLAQRIVEQV